MATPRLRHRPNIELRVIVWKPCYHSLLDFDEWDDTECESDEDYIDDSTFNEQEENKFYQEKSRSLFQSPSESDNRTEFTRYEEDVGDPISNEIKVQRIDSDTINLDIIDLKDMPEEVKRIIENLDERTLKILSVAENELQKVKQENSNYSYDLQKVDQQKSQLEFQLSNLQEQLQRAHRESSQLSITSSSSRTLAANSTSGNSIIR